MRWTLGCSLALALLAASANAQVQPGDIVLNVWPDRLDHYRPDGTLVATTAGNGAGGNFLGAAVTPTGFVMSRRVPAGVNVFDLQGQEVFTFDTPEVFLTSDVDVFADGTIVLCDVGVGGGMEWYSQAGNHVMSVSIPSGASTDGCHVDFNNELWAVSATGSIAHFDSNGNLLGGFNLPFMQLPIDLIVAPDGTLWVADYLAATFYNLQPTGQIISIGTGFGSQAGGIGMAPDGTLYAASFGSDLVRHLGPNGGFLDEFPIDPAGGPQFMTVVGNFASPPVAYCTAKTNSLGCLPAIGQSGIPSALLSSGFTVTATNVRNHKAGVLLYTVDGRGIVPFQGGVLCLAPPVRRTPARSSGGSHPALKDCSGGWRIDMNAFAAGQFGGQPDPALRQPGTFVHCQWWGRDPGDVHGSALTDALQYRIAPQ